MREERPVACCSTAQPKKLQERPGAPSNWQHHFHRRFLPRCTRNCAESPGRCGGTRNAVPGSRTPSPIGEQYIEGEAFDPTTKIRPTFRVDLTDRRTQRLINSYGVQESEREYAIKAT